MQDAWRAYLEMALGLTEAPRKKAQKVATELLTKGGATAGQLQGLVEDLMSTGVANREALTNIVRYEVDRALGKVGLATADEVSELTSRVRDLEKQLRAAQAGTGGDAGELTIAEPGPVAVVPPAKKAPVKKAVAKKVVKATPNAMPAAATTETPVRAKKTGPAAKKATPATTAPAKDKPAKAAKATKAAKAAGASPEPAGTAASPTAPVKAAAAETVLPPVRKTAARKGVPAKKAAGTEPSAPEASS